MAVVSLIHMVQMAMETPLAAWFSRMRLGRWRRCMNGRTLYPPNCSVSVRAKTEQWHPHSASTYTTRWVAFGTCLPTTMLRYLRTAKATAESLWAFMAHRPSTKVIPLPRPPTLHHLLPNAPARQPSAMVSIYQARALLHPRPHRL